MEEGGGGEVTESPGVLRRTGSLGEAEGGGWGGRNSAGGRGGGGGQWNPGQTGLSRSRAFTG